MSGGSKRRHSKWDNKDSESLPGDFYDRATPRRPREPFSLGRGSRRHDSRSRESTMTLDREGNCTRISPELDEWRPRHSSRSPRNGWSRSLRISRSRSRSRSRSQSPVHHLRREPAVNDRSRNRSGASGQICRDFAAGRCRRGHSCHFLHQDAQLYDNRRSLECSPPDDLEGRRRRTGSSKYSPDDNKDNTIRTEKSAHNCNDFLKGRCRRGDTCRFVHHDTSADEFEKGPVEEFYRNRDHEHRSRDARDTYPDHDHRSRDTYPEHDRRSRDTYPDLDHRSRDSDHNYRNREPYNDHDGRSRESYPDHDHRRKDTYPDRNHEGDPPRRGEIPCKFFASGNCRNGSRCRFSHQVQEAFSPERRSRDDKRDTDRKFEGRHGWDGPRWNDATTVSTVPTVPGWEEDKNENKEANTLRIQDDGRGPNPKYEVDRVWDGPSWTDATSLPNVSGVHVPTVPGWEEDKIENKEANTLRIQDDGRGPDPKYEVDQVWDGPSWTDATSLPKVSGVHDWGDNKNEFTEVAEVVTGARPRDDSWGHNMLIKPTWHPPATAIDKCQIQDKEDPLQWKTENNIPIMGLSTPRGMDNFPGDMEISPRDIKHQTILNSSTSQIPSISAVQLGTADEDSSFEKHYHTDSFTVQNATYKDNAPISYPVERRDMGDHDVSSIIQNQAITIPQGQDIFQPDKNANVNPIPNATPPRQSQPSVLSHPHQGEGMQEVSHNPSIGPHVGSVPSSEPAPGSTAHSTVSNEQLAQLSHLTASLTQLLESRQQLSQLSSAISPHGMPNLHDLAAPAPPVSGAMIQPNQAPDVDPVSNSNEPKMPNLGDRRLPSVEQKSSINETHEINNVNLQEHLGSSKDEENGKETVRFKAPENEPSQDVGPDGADDSKKLKDIKGIRPFKFALAEFVKELLKPSWKDGQVSKEAYKTIVKKVVDKVMETLGPQIPQTKEKIDLYLSCSRPKIDKLVQAYVEKHQKG